MSAAVKGLPFSGGVVLTTIDISTVATPKREVAFVRTEPFELCLSIVLNFSLDNRCGLGLWGGTKGSEATLTLRLETASQT